MNSKLEGLGSADSMKAAAELLSWPIPAVKAMKRAGCPAFRNTRVDIGALIVWAGNNVFASDTTDWSVALKKEQTLKLRRERDIAESKTLPADEVRDGIARINSTLYTGMERVFLGEMPADLYGRQPQDIAERMKQAIERFRAEMLAAWEAGRNGAIPS